MLFKANNLSSKKLLHAKNAIRKNEITTNFPLPHSFPQGSQRWGAGPPAPKDGCLPRAALRAWHGLEATAGIVQTPESVGSTLLCRHEFGLMQRPEEVKAQPCWWYVSDYKNSGEGKLLENTSKDKPIATHWVWRGPDYISDFHSLTDQSQVSNKSNFPPWPMLFCPSKAAPSWLRLTFNAQLRTCHLPSASLANPSSLPSLSLWNLYHLSRLPLMCLLASQVALVVKNPPANAGDMRDVALSPGSEKSPGGGHDNPPQYSCLENPTDRGAWRLHTVQGHKESDTTKEI